MACNPLTNLTGCLGTAAGGQTSSAGISGWNAVCQSFAKAAQQLLGSFAKSFVSIPPIDLSYAGVRSVYGLSLEIAAVVAAVLLMVQVIRTVMVHDGSALAQGFTGIGKAVLAFVLTLGAAATALRASDELTSWIIARTFGSPQALSVRLGQLASFNAGVSASLLFVLALLGIVLTLALWAQLLIRNVAVTVLVAVSPIAAAGQVAHATQQWWRKLVRATIQLIVLKPVVALVFAVGLTMPGTSGSVEKLLAGMLVLLLAGIAWPAMARASAVLEVYVGGGALTGGRGGADVAPSGSPGGVNPAELSRVAEARTMAAVHELRTRTVEARREAPGSRLSPPLRVGIEAVGEPGAHAMNAIGSGAHGADGAGRPGLPSGGDQTAAARDDIPRDDIPTAVPGDPARAVTGSDGAPLLGGRAPGATGAPGSWRNR
jgi:hypothetical protein